MKALNANVAALNKTLAVFLPIIAESLATIAGELKADPEPDHAEINLGKPEPQQ